MVTGCRPESVVAAIFDFAAMGLAPDPSLEWGYFRRNGDTARAGLGYKGVIHLMAKDPNFHSLDVQTIYSGDTDGEGGEPRVVMGTSPRVDHCASLTGPREDKDVVGVYGILHWRTGGPPKIEYMGRAQVEQVRAASADPDGWAWREWWGAMARKSVIHRMRKYVQVAPELAHVLASDESGDYVPMTPAPAPVPTPAGKSKLDTLEEVADLYGTPKG